ncbi:MAG: VWA domain-containing protein [Chlamydiales bacterium]|nr:VWA domain-containing protein [Chlamydiales bacterium]
MDLSQLHFAHSLWLLMLLVIPLVWGLFFLYYQGQQPLHQLEKFIDKHLIPYLLIGGESQKKRLWPPLLFWSLVWSCLVLALAGPRWDFREVSTFSRDQSLTLLLDLSESMNAKDISPSRLGRAKQKVEDLLNMSKGIKIGLVAFAADPHMIVPMTEDKETIRHLLPSLDTDLVYVQGSKLAPALEMADRMLENEPGSNKAVVVISDGGFEDASAINTAGRLAAKGIVLHTIGVGTLEGAPLKDRQGAVVKKNGSPIISKLEKEKFREISKIGHGRYFDADHSGQISLIIKDLEKRSDVQGAPKTQRFWEEHFYLFILPVLPFFLWWYRRGYIFALLLFSVTTTDSHASLSNYFYNPEQQAGQAFEDGDYLDAADAFQDPYRKGVAYYRQGEYAAAEKMFRQSTRPEVASSAGYNLGNALALQNKLKEAVVAYEDVLEKWPDHKEAKENLEVIKKMLEEQEQKDDDSPEDQPQEQPKDAENPEKQEKPDSDEPSEEPPEEKEPPQDEEQAQQPEEQAPPPPAQEKEKPTPRSEDDLDADLWLNQIKSDPKSFLKNKFYLESKKNGTKEEVDPW